MCTVIILSRMTTFENPEYIHTSLFLSFVFLNLLPLTYCFICGCGQRARVDSTKKWLKLKSSCPAKRISSLTNRHEVEWFHRLMSGSQRTVNYKCHSFEAWIARSMNNHSYVMPNAFSISASSEKLASIRIQYILVLILLTLFYLLLGLCNFCARFSV